MTYNEAKATTLEDAVWEVLEQRTKDPTQEPMRAAEIWREIDNQGWAATATWADPAFQVACHINALINQEADGGEESPYKKVRKGLFRVKESGDRNDKVRHAGENVGKKEPLRWKIEKALKEERGSMHYRDIAEKIGESMYSVSATISIIRKGGDDSCIVSKGKGFFSLPNFDAPATDASKKEGSGLVKKDDSDEEGIGLVKAFGMFWDAGKVDWGCATPKILGRMYNNKEQKVDFHDQKGVYVLYDGHRPVYVGESSKKKGVIGKRLRTHATDKKQGRWDKFSWFGFCPVEDDDMLGDADVEINGVQSLIILLESVLIEIVEPSLNRQQGNGLKDIEYMQVTDNDDKQQLQLQQLQQGIETLAQQVQNIKK